MEQLFGEIRELYRYPVKSMGGERIASCLMERYGVYGDRFCAFVDETKHGWSRFVTGRNVPELLAYDAKLVGGEVQVTSPEGVQHCWDEALLHEIQAYSDTKLSMSVIKEPHPENSNLLSVDVSSVLIISDVSLRRLEAVWGRSLDPKRFRANMIVTLADDAGDEGAWIGRRIAVGGAELRVDGWCRRCSMVNIDPDTRLREPSLLATISKEMNVQFGVYASVMKTGHVREGDQVYALNA